jgi:hypothetical protein
MSTVRPRAAVREELRLVEEDLGQLRRTAASLRERIGERADEPTDPAERAAVIENAEEQEGLIDELEVRRDKLLAELGGRLSSSAGHARPGHVSLACARGCSRWAALASPGVDVLFRRGEQIGQDGGQARGGSSAATYRLRRLRQLLPDSWQPGAAEHSARRGNSGSDHTCLNSAPEQRMRSCDPARLVQLPD